MIPRLRRTGVPVIWRAHVGLDLPNELARDAWRFLLGDVEQADAYVFSRPATRGRDSTATRSRSSRRRSTRSRPKNHAMSFTGVTAVLRAAGLAADHHHVPRAIFERPDGSVGQVDPRGTCHRGGGAAPRRPAARAGLAMGPAEGPARGDARVRRARPGRRGPAPRARRTRRHCGRRRPGGRGGPRRGRGGLARPPARRPPAGAPRAAADG